MYELATVPAWQVAEDQRQGLAERHRLYSLLVMALVHRYWNGNKYGPRGSYPRREKQRVGEKLYRGATRSDAKAGEYDFDYLGHNIACIAVDARGEVMDFDFNHNEVLDSSVEHAESRLVRRVFSLARLEDGWKTREGGLKREEYGNILSSVTIYTSLESCAQCSGIMALGKVKEVVYLQQDPGMYAVGNILFNLTHVGEDKLPAPYPLAATAFGFKYSALLDTGFQAYLQREKTTGEAFFTSLNGDTRGMNSVTSYLCTDEAMAIFEQAASDFLAKPFDLSHADFIPTEKGKRVDGAMSNAAVLSHLQRFFKYASEIGERGTPHKL
ncbi:MAG: hypothetical protein QM765_42985 [Myxococcales bacterium]